MILVLLLIALANSQYTPGYQYLELYDKVQDSWVYARLHYPSDAPKNTTFPLIVFSPGWVQSSTFYDYLWTEWVPMGYAVAMMSTYDFDPNSDPVSKAYDQMFILSYLQNASQHDSTSPIYGLLNSVSAAMGHSEGGWSSLFAGDPSWTNYSYPGRFSATLTLSACWGDDDDANNAVAHQTTPIFFITATHDCYCDDSTSLTFFNVSASTCKYVADIIDGEHCDFAWDGLGNIPCRLVGAGAGCAFDWIIDPFTQQTIVKSYATPWINWILKGDNSAQQKLNKQLNADKQNSVSYNDHTC